METSLSPAISATEEFVAEETMAIEEIVTSKSAGTQAAKELAKPSGAPLVLGPKVIEPPYLFPMDPPPVPVKAKSNEPKTPSPAMQIRTKMKPETRPGSP